VVNGVSNGASPKDLNGKEAEAEVPAEEVVVKKAAAAPAAPAEAEVAAEAWSGHARNLVPPLIIHHKPEWPISQDRGVWCTGSRVEAREVMKRWALERSVVRADIAAVMLRQY